MATATGFPFILLTFCFSTPSPRPLACCDWPECVFVCIFQLKETNPFMSGDSSQPLMAEKLNAFCTKLDQVREMMYTGLCIGGGMSVLCRLTVCLGFFSFCLILSSFFLSLFFCLCLCLSLPSLCVSVSLCLVHPLCFSVSVALSLSPQL